MKFVNQWIAIMLIIGVGILFFGCREENQPASESKVTHENKFTESEDYQMRDLPNKKRFIQNKERLQKLKKSVHVVQADLQVQQDGNEFLFEYTLENRSDEDLRIIFPSGQDYDFFIYNDHDELVYRWSEGKMFIMAMHETVLAAGEKIQIQEKWDGRNREGGSVPPGEYRILFQLTAHVETTDKKVISEKDLMATAEFRIDE